VIYCKITLSDGRLIFSCRVECQVSAGSRMQTALSAECCHAWSDVCSTAYCSTRNTLVPFVRCISFNVYWNALQGLFSEKLATESKPCYKATFSNHTFMTSSKCNPLYQPTHCHSPHEAIYHNSCFEAGIPTPSSEVRVASHMPDAILVSDRTMPACILIAFGAAPS